MSAAHEEAERRHPSTGRDPDPFEVGAGLGFIEGWDAHAEQTAGVERHLERSLADAAALREMLQQAYAETPEHVEAMARAAFEESKFDDETWETTAPETREVFRVDARAALAALREMNGES